jgi:hypothetical protein
MNTQLENPYKDTPVSRAIMEAVNGSPAGKLRNAALKRVKWVLRSGSMYILPCSDNLESPLTTEKAEALQFDGRDNPDLKAVYFTALFKAPFTPELV